MTLILNSLEIIILVEDYAGFTSLMAEHGFSALVSIKYEGERNYNLLFDTGQTGRALFENAERLNIDLSSVEVIVLSHRHYDHTGGLPKLIEPLKEKPLIAHPAITRPCIDVSKEFVRLNIGLPLETREALANFELITVKEALRLAPDVWFLGEVERVYDNRYAIKGFNTLVDGDIIEEPMPDDTGLAIKVGDKAVVLAGCSHSGISNIVRQAKKVVGAHGVIVVGGLHLVSADGIVINRVINELLDEGVEEVYMGHCTGLRGEAKLLEAFKDKAHKIHSGYRIKVRAK
ncbi:MAG: MBL fold metallo-hydrolase [Candidatus Nezhaarchaeales archaeon]